MRADVGAVVTPQKGRIRRYSPADLNAVLAVYARAKPDELQYEATDFTIVPLNQDADRFNGFLQSDVFLYEAGQQVLAYGACFQNEIRALYVDRSARGQGIGMALLRHLLLLIDGDPVLHVVKSNQPALQLYRRVGFVEEKEISVEYNGQQVAVYMMRLTSGSSLS